MAPHPPRPSKKPLERFVGTAGTRQTPEQRAELLAFVAAGYNAALSLRELAELTDRTQTAVRRRALDHGSTGGSGTRSAPGSMRTPRLEPQGPATHGQRQIRTFWFIDDFSPPGYRKLRVLRPFRQ